MKREKKELIIITGVSGAGKSSAIGYLEDFGYYCIDNLPMPLIEDFISLLCNGDEYKKSAIVVDIRSTRNFEKLIESVGVLKKNNCDVKIIYFDIRTAEAIKRYRLTRRLHPLSDEFNGDIELAVRDEKRILGAMRSCADHIIDTTNINPPELKTRLTEIVSGSNKGVMNIHCISFGFKYGIPTNADFVIDVRCLPNPYWVEEFRDKTGLDKDVDEYVFAFEESNELLARLIDMVDFLNPLYIKEGKSQIVFAIGCTGGKHRSVAFAEKLKAHFQKKWDNVSVFHRDIECK